MKAIPLEDRVVILQDEGKAQTETGILVPEQSVKKPPIGTIKFIGPGKGGKNEIPIGYLVNDEFLAQGSHLPIKVGDRVVPVYSMALKVGDRVMFSNYSGAPIMLDGVEHLVMRVSELICRV